MGDPNREKLDEPLIAENDAEPIALQSPACVMVARTNADAHLIAIYLNQSGVPAQAVDDISMVGYFTLGTIDNIHRPKVYVDRSQLEEARLLLKDREAIHTDEPVSPFCYHCGADMGASEDQSTCPECHRALSDETESLEMPPTGPDATGERQVSFLMLFVILLFMIVPGLLLFLSGLLKWI